MTKKSAKSPVFCKIARCLHRYPAGRRCRFPLADSSSFYCERHAYLRPPGADTADFAPDLIGKLAEFSSASEINQFLSKLLILLSQDRIPPRRAAVLAYISSLLLRTLPEIDREREGDSDQTRPEIILPDWIEERRAARAAEALARSEDRASEPAVAPHSPSAYTTNHLAETMRESL